MSLTGVRFYASPQPGQKQTLGQWIGCRRFVWNAKCEENTYLFGFKQKFCSINTRIPIDQSYSQFKSTELSPWLSDCPSQILRNTMSVWHKTMMAFLKGDCGMPQKKRKSEGGSIWLTSELFRFDTGPDGKKQLFIGTKTNNIGYLSFYAHRDFGEPKSICIKQKQGRYTLSFCYEEAKTDIAELTLEEHLQSFSNLHRIDLDAITVGVDRGVVIPIHTGQAQFDFSPEQKRSKFKATVSIKILQKRLSRQTKGCRRRTQTKHRLGRKHQKITNIRTDFAHQTSHKIVSNKDTQIIVFEDLRTEQLVKKPKPKIGPAGRFIKNGSAAKAGLNKAILDKGWGQLETYCAYKAKRAGKAFFKISASFTSQECADCAHIHPSNRVSQAEFVCENCGYSDNADRNAALVIKKRAINLILDPGTGLSTRGVLTPGRYRARSSRKTGMAKAFSAMGNEASKMMELSLAA